MILIDSVEEEGIPMREVDLQRERDTQVEIEGLPEEEDYQVMEDPQTDPLENHLEEEDLIEEDWPDRGGLPSGGGPPDD